VATSVVMPALELAQETGKVIAWKKQEGDNVTKGEPLLEIETDKAVVEVEAPGDGILSAISAQAGEDVPVGRTIAWLLGTGEDVPAEALASPVQTGRTGTGLAAERPRPHAAAEAPHALDSTPRISPKARRLAREHGVDLRAVRGSGPEGEVLASDIESVVQTGGADEASGAQVESVGTVWKRMAERTAQSWSEIPHFFLTREVDASELVQHRAPLKEKGVTYTDCLVALVARILRKHPRFNASWTAEGIRIHQDIHMGVAVDGGDGVVVAVIRNADNRPLPAIAADRQAIAERVRAGRATPADLAGATFTISNMGMRRVDAFTAIINPPQAAILAVGSLVDRVVAVDGLPAVRPVLTLTLSSDHRVVDGARAAAMMDDLAGAIGDPNTWLT
jgi:pyruvate dehydrogenase E2 component (dihydrolipoamide acetyltransferase)